MLLYMISVVFLIGACSADGEIFQEVILVEEDLEEVIEDNSENDDETNSSEENEENSEEQEENQESSDEDTGSQTENWNSEIDPSITIATWKNFASSAISHTWDDSYNEQIEIAVPLFDSYDMNTTLFMLPNKINNWEKYRQAYLNGHEIGSHTLSHPNFNGMGYEAIEAELKTSKELIEQNLGMADCNTFAYPYCSTENFGLTEQYYIAARSCQSTVEGSTPNDFMNIASFLCGEGTSYNTTESLNSIARSALQTKGWGVYLFHLIDGAGGFTISSDVLDQHLAFLSENKEDFWVDSFVNVIKYIKQRNSAVMEIISENENQITLSYIDNLDNGIYNYPISFQKEIPGEWNNSAVKVIQNGEIRESYITEEDDNGVAKKYLVFNVIPDRGEILIGPNN